MEAKNACKFRLYAIMQNILQISNFTAKNPWILWVMITMQYPPSASSRFMYLHSTNESEVIIISHIYNQASQYLDFNVIRGWKRSTDLMISDEKLKGQCNLKLLSMIFVSLKVIS